MKYDDVAREGEPYGLARKERRPLKDPSSAFRSKVISILLQNQPKNERKQQSIQPVSGLRDIQQTTATEDESLLEELRRLHGQEELKLQRIRNGNGYVELN